MTEQPVNTGDRLPIGRGRSPKAKTLIAFSALIMLLFCVFVAYQASKAYEHSIEDGKTNAARLTHILADQVDLHELVDGGHYFLRTRPAEAAEAVLVHTH